LGTVTLSPIASLMMTTNRRWKQSYFLLLCTHDTHFNYATTTISSQISYYYFVNTSISLICIHCLHMWLIGLSTLQVWLFFW
jgi:hypothetical protein